MSELVSQTRMAELLGVTARSMRNWKDCPRRPDGQYVPAEVGTWYAERFKARLDLERETARLKAEQADKTAWENSKRRGELIAATIAADAWVSLLTPISGHAARLEDPALAAELVGLPAAEIRARLTAVVREILHDAARG